MMTMDRSVAALLNSRPLKSSDRIDKARRRQSLTSRLPFVQLELKAGEASCQRTPSCIAGCHVSSRGKQLDTREIQLQPFDI